MKEYIKILENLIKEYKNNVWNEYPYKFNKEIIYALENLIQRNKELEEIEEVLEYFKFCRGNLPKDTLLIVMCNEDFCRNFGNDYISKDKIKEKIKELEKMQRENIKKFNKAIDILDLDTITELDNKIGVNFYVQDILKEGDKNV